jgi:membrane-bound ClpP family serine protease
MATINHHEHKVWLRVWQLYIWGGMAFVVGGTILFIYGLVSSKILNAEESGLALIALGAVMMLLSTVGVQKSKMHVKQLKKSRRARR